MTNYKQPGNSMEYQNAGSAIASGAIVPLGDRCGVAKTDIAASTGKGTLDLDGVYQCAKDADEAFAQGDMLYYDASDSTLTKTAAGNTPFGIAHEIALEAATTCLARLQDHPKRSANVAAVAVADADATYGQPEADLINALKVAVNAILAGDKASGQMKNS